MRLSNPGLAIWSTPLVPNMSPAAMGWIVVKPRGEAVASNRSPQAARMASGQPNPLDELAATVAPSPIEATAWRAVVSLDTLNFP